MWKKESNVGVQRIGSRLTGGGTDSTCAKLCAWLSRKLPSSSPKCFHHFHFHQEYIRAPVVSQLCQHWALYFIAFPMDGKWYLCDFHSISLVPSVGNFPCVSWPFAFPFVKCLFQYFTHFKNEVVCLCIVDVSALYIFLTHVLCQMANIFSQARTCLLICWMVS